MFKSLREVISHWELVRMFVARDLIVRYRNSVLGVLWSLATPLAQMVFLTIVFRLFLRVDEPNYSFKLLSAMLAFNFFRDVTLNACSCIVENRALICKVYFPREVLPISIVLGNTVHFLIALVMMLLIFAFRPVAITPAYLFIPVLIVVQIILLTGIALLVACAHTFYHDVRYMIDAMMQALFFMTPIVYSSDVAKKGIVAVIQRFFPGHEMLAQWVFQLYMLNPMATICEAYRGVLLRNELPDATFFVPLVIISLVVFVLGYRTFVKHSWRFPEII